MEKIGKKIIVESAKSRVPGLIPSSEIGYYKYNINHSAWEKLPLIDKIDITKIKNESVYGVMDGNHTYRVYSVTADGSINYIEKIATIVYSNADFNDNDKIYFSYGLNANNGNWNKYPCDINIAKINDDEYISLLALSENTNFPLTYIDGKRSLLRYRNMMDVYYWLKNFYKDLKIYRLCKRNNIKYWSLTDNINYDNLDIESIHEELPDVNDNVYEIDSLIGINSEAKQYYDYFVMEDNNIFFSDRLDIKFYEFVKKSIGMLTIPLNIEGNIVPNFLFYSEISEWYEWLNENKNTDDCCIRLEYIEKGGNDMLDFLSDKLDLVDITLKFFENLIVIPYISFSISLKDSIDDIGEYSLYSNEWVAGKKYYVGDTVIYLSTDNIYGESYILRYGDQYELLKLPPSLYSEISNNTFYSIRNYTENDAYIISSKKNFMEDGSGKRIVYYLNNEYYLPLAFYCGYYDKLNRDTYFDEIDQNGNLCHWVLNASDNDINRLNIDGYNDKWKPSEIVLSAITESKLQSLKRYKKSYDDDGNELPGVIVYSNNGIINEYLELEFQSGVAFNIVELKDETDEVTYYYGDIIESIEYSDSLDNEFTAEKNNETKYIKFIYYIGSRLEQNNDKWIVCPNTGVKYTEIYQLYVNVMLSDVKIDGRTYNLLYDLIDFTSKTMTIYSEDLDFAPKKTIISNIEFTSNQMFGKNVINDSFNIINSPIFKEEYKMGITYPVKTTNEVYVDRGINAAFERHLILGEINTYQDMVNYRNDYFNLNESL